MKPERKLLYLPEAMPGPYIVGLLWERPNLLAIDRARSPSAVGR
jgi:hypothetical protein